MGDSLRGRNHFLNGSGDALGQKESKPDGSENDQQGHDGEGNEMARFERMLQQLELQVVVMPRRNGRQFLGDA